ncbi:metallophosphoesterase [Pseudoalteromonas sp. MMG013]|uniref:Icc protein n=1 Tax=Pseudoalteromonas aurantia 208 TaxID=1314867 RepID=A0ABR9E7U0_9GAMM|nr:MULTISPECIES: metallophosphoesterase [Pseudoalteromonas]MBE0366862.1 Icc protein [Pseudoalteromonas aurantia 208]MBQ4847024.1 metallophosphoesterase [Pseudoalteromonas sp. MMG005]MBQ4861470.1 metallophosphoesterase [Pseudoalteromonas sp. MMG013]
MAWFRHPYHFDKSSIKLAHITDSHLFCDEMGTYFTVNTADNFKRTLSYMATCHLDAVIFGGDLTQDHSVESYQLFAELVRVSELDCPVFWLPGNHDELTELEQISLGQIHSNKHLRLNGADIFLINSKGETPAGWCEQQHLFELHQMLLCSSEQVLAFSHHHPVPINGYLDKHILENGPALLNCLVNSNKAVRLVHGHVHNDYQSTYRTMHVLATPATSIQFNKGTSQWQQQDRGPALRIINFGINGFDSEVIWLDE